MDPNLLKLVAVVGTFVGVIGAVLPGLPGPGFILITGFGLGLLTSFTVPSWSTLVWLGVLTLVGYAGGQTAAAIGARRFGASRWGWVGALVGGLIGLFILGPIGLVVGPLAGATLAELSQGRPFPVAVRAGVGALLGSLGGAVFQLVIAVVMASIFLSAVF